MKKIFFILLLKAHSFDQNFFQDNTKGKKFNITIQYQATNPSTKTLQDDSSNFISTIKSLKEENNIYKKNIIDLLNAFQSVKKSNQRYSTMIQDLNYSILDYEEKTKIICNNFFTERNELLQKIEDLENENHEKKSIFSTLWNFIKRFFSCINDEAVD